MSPRLIVMLGEGGVGKTTLAAGRAIALARAGRRVGLLGVDPARRLASALGLGLGDREVAVPCGGDLRAALLRPEESLRRWAGDDAILTANPFFVAIADRLAASVDAIASIRAVEWADDHPALDDLIIDTAPGKNAIDLLRRPAYVAALLEGSLVRWLRGHGLVERGVRRALSGLAYLVGAAVLRDLSELSARIEPLATRMLDRLARAHAWLRDPSTELVVVSSTRADAADAAIAIARAITATGLSVGAVAVNRALPRRLPDELAALPIAAEPEARAILRYVAAQVAAEERVIDALSPLAPRLVMVPWVKGLDEDGAMRLDALASIGDALGGPDQS